MSTALVRPEPTEYGDFYRVYVNMVGEGSILRLLTAQRDAALQLLRSIDEERAEHRYAVGKWSIKEVIGHVTDSERVFAYRALCFARGERAPQPGFDQDAYVAAADFNRRSLGDLAAEFSQVRYANVTLFGGFDEDVWLRRGVANGVEFTVRSIPYIIAGHELHHIAVIRERYL
jgi:hypothetical protein